MDTSSSSDLQNEVTRGEKRRRKFSKAFKREAVSLLHSSGKPLSEIAREDR